MSNHEGITINRKSADVNSSENSDGSLTVRFRAGGIQESRWHLVTWGASVTVQEPPVLRRRLTEMCASLARHHRLG